MQSTAVAEKAVPLLGPRLEWPPTLVLMDLDVSGMDGCGRNIRDAASAAWRLPGGVRMGTDSGCGRRALTSISSSQRGVAELKAVLFRIDVRDARRRF